MDVSLQAVEEVIRRYRADFLIHGHTHKPARTRLTVDGFPAEHIVLGAWGAEAPGETFSYPPDFFPVNE